MSERVRALILEYDNLRELEFYAGALPPLLPELDIVTASSPAQALERCAGASVLAAKAHNVSAALLAAMPNLRFIQALTTGIDHIEQLAVPEEVAVASARGIHGPQMAELAILQMLALSRDFVGMVRNQANRVWQRWPQAVLFEKTVMILGVGLIAEALALRCQAFGMHVVGISGRTQAPHFDEIFPRTQMEDVAGRADYLVVLAPYSAATHHMVDAALLAALKPGAILVNVARGGVVDEAAVLAALRSGRLRAAGLDVFATEPLPETSELWTEANVIVTPHVGGMSERYAHDLLPLLEQNLRAFCTGGAMRNLVRPGALPQPG